MILSDVITVLNDTVEGSVFGINNIHTVMADTLSSEVTFL